MSVELPEPRHEPARQRFVISADGSEAVLEYRIQGQQVDFTRTFVPPELRGGGVAARLVQAGLDWATDAGLEPEGSCSYVAKVLARREG